MTRLRIRATLILATLAILAAACTTAEDPPTTTEAPTTSTETPTDEATAGVDGSPQAAGLMADTTIGSDEYSFSIPEITSGNHVMELRNDGEEVHMAIFIRLLQGKTVDDALAYIEENGVGGKPPKWTEQVAFGIAAPGTTAPIAAGSGGKNSPPPSDGVDLPIGEYVVLCFVPEGMTDMNQKPDPEAQTHADLGMIQGFTVGLS